MFTNNIAFNKSMHETVKVSAMRYSVSNIIGCFPSVSISQHHKNFIKYNIWHQYIINITRNLIYINYHQNKHVCSLPHMGAFGRWARRAHCVPSLNNMKGNLERKGNWRSHHKQ